MTTNSLLWFIIGLILYFLYRQYFQNKKNNIEFIDTENDLNHLILENDEYCFTEMYIDGNKFNIYHRTVDYTSEFNSTYEYKIEWDKVYQRILDDKIEHAWDKPYHRVQDWVVLESNIITKIKNDQFNIKFKLINDELFKEKIDEVSKMCVRHELTDYRMKYFLMFRNNDNLWTDLIRKLFRSDLEKIKLCMLKLEELCNQYNAKLSYNNSNPWFSLKWEESESKETEFLEQVDIILKDMEFTRSDIGYFESRIETLNSYLNKF